MEERQRALHEEAQQQKGLADAERVRRSRAEADVEAKEAELVRLRGEFETQQRENEARERRMAEEKREQREKLSAEVARAGKRSQKSARAVRRLCGVVSIFGAVVAGGMWSMDAVIAEQMLQWLEWEPQGAYWVALAARVVGAGVLVGSFLPSVRLLRRNFRLSALTAVVAFGIGGVDLVGPDVLAEVAGYLAVGLPVALALTIILEWRGVVDADGG